MNPVSNDDPIKVNENVPISEERFVLEDFKKCSESHLWKLMMSFYDRKGVESWSQGIVPHFITCNSFIGKSYAKVLLGFIRDCCTPGKNKMTLDKSEPLYIIELGAGSGKFSYYMLKALEEMQAICDFPIDKIVFVMTDFTENNYNFWDTHPVLKPYFERGVLDAGIFDAVNDEEIILRKSGKILKIDSCKNPICIGIIIIVIIIVISYYYDSFYHYCYNIVANYLFDTLYHDIFQIDGGVLKEGLVSVGSKNSKEPDTLEPEIITRLDNRYKYQTIDPSYYDNEDGDEVHLRRILKWYRDYFKNNANGASLLIPIGSLILYFYYYKLHYYYHYFRSFSCIKKIE